MKPIVEDSITLLLGGLPLSVLAVAVACSNGGVEVADASDSTRALERSIDDYCEAQCEHETCDPGDSFADCLDECHADSLATESWRDSYVVAVSACLREIGCDGKDDDCYEGAAEAQPDPDRLSPRCQARLEQCEDEREDRAFSNDFCLSILSLNDTRRAAVAGCLERDCSVIGECLANLGAFTP